MSVEHPGAPEDLALEAPAAEVQHGCPVTSSRGQRVLHVPRARYVEVIGALLDEGFHMILDVTAVDYLLAGTREVPAEITPERFEIVVNLLSMQRRERIRVRVQVPGDDLVMPSLFDLFPGTEAAEREVFDMFGIRFDGHPDLSRILMPEDWEGHPLRKDFAMGKIPVQFKAAPGAR